MLIGVSKKLGPLAHKKKVWQPLVEGITMLIEVIMENKAVWTQETWEQTARLNISEVLLSKLITSQTWPSALLGVQRQGLTGVTSHPARTHQSLRWPHTVLPNPQHPGGFKEESVMTLPVQTQCKMSTLAQKPKYLLERHFWGFLSSKSPSEWWRPRLADMVAHDRQRFDSLTRGGSSSPCSHETNPPPRALTAANK